MSAFDICVIVFVSAAFVAVVATLIYNKIKGKGSPCGGCDGCSACTHCSSCSQCNTQNGKNSDD